MKTNKLSKTIALKAGNAKLKLKKYSPEILTAVGITSGVATVIAACKATLKAPEIVNDTKKNIDAVHDASELGEKSLADYSEEDRKKDLTIIYAKSLAKFIKIYAPAIILASISTTSILASQNILKTRNAALASAYAIADKGFKDYRERVVERFGEKVDDELRYNIKAKTFEKIEVNEDGEGIAKQETIDVVDDNTIDNAFIKWFDESCDGWDKDPDARKLFLIQQQRYANDKLQARGHLFLNEVYDMLGFKRTALGQEMGWIWNPANPKLNNYVDFGLKKDRNRDFINGWDECALLTFNVDGPILNSLDER